MNEKNETVTLPFHGDVEELNKKRIEICNLVDVG